MMEWENGMGNFEHLKEELFLMNFITVSVNYKDVATKIGNCINVNSQIFVRVSHTCCSSKKSS